MSGGSDISWFLRIERELGAMTERNRALELSDQHIRRDMQEATVRHERSLAEAVRLIGAEVARENAHTRGEVNRIISEVSEHRRVDERRQEEHARKTEENHATMVAELRTDLEEARQEAGRVLLANRRIIAGVGIAVVLGQQLLENMPFLLRVFSDFIGE